MYDDSTYSVSSKAIELRNLQKSEGFRMICEEYERNKNRILAKIFNRKTDDADVLALREAYIQICSSDFDPQLLAQRLHDAEYSTKKQPLENKPIRH